MSDLTKTCAVIVAPVVLAALAVEGCRHAAKRLAQHAAEAECRRRQRLARRGQELRAELACEIAQVDTFAHSAVGQHVKNELQLTRNSLAKLGEESLEDELRIADVKKRLKRLRKSLADAVARAETIQLAAEIGQVEAALLQLRRKVAAGLLLSRQFDLDGLREVDAQVEVVESLLQRQRLAQAEQEMARLQESFARHQTRVEAAQDRWNGLHEEAATAAATVNERLASLQADEIIRRWHGSDLEALVRRAGELEGSVSAGRFTQVHQECGSLMTEADKLIAAADEAQRCEDERNYVAMSLMDSLAELGFWVQQFPAEQAPADATIRATRSDGRALTVSIPLNGSLRWTAEGFPLELANGSDGQPVRDCRELAEQIEAVKGCLEKHGVGTGELLWNGKDPDRPSKTAKRLPRSAVRSSPQTRGASAS